MELQLAAEPLGSTALLQSACRPAWFNATRLAGICCVTFAVPADVAGDVQAGSSYADKFVPCMA